MNSRLTDADCPSLTDNAIISIVNWPSIKPTYAESRTLLRKAEKAFAY